MAERNPELADVNDHEIAVRMSLLLVVIDQGMTAQDERVHNPLSQLRTLLDELDARHPKPVDQVVALSTLNLKGERPPLGT